jgi:hypothetical protein
MHEPAGNGIKAWAPTYTEAPFFFEQQLEGFSRLVSWSDNPEQIERAFFAIVELLPDPVDILLKVAVGSADDGEPLWMRFDGRRRRDAFIAAARANEFFVFSDGAHQLTVKDPAREHYLTLDEHGIFFVYEPTPSHHDVFRALGFGEREAPLIYALPHFHRVSSDATRQRRFIYALGLLPATRSQLR